MIRLVWEDLIELNREDPRLATHIKDLLVNKVIIDAVFHATHANI